MIYWAGTGVVVASRRVGAADPVGLEEKVEARAGGAATVGFQEKEAAVVARAAAGEPEVETASAAVVA